MSPKIRTDCRLIEFYGRSVELCLHGGRCSQQPTNGKPKAKDGRLVRPGIIIATIKKKCFPILHCIHILVYCVLKWCVLRCRCFGRWLLSTIHNFCLQICTLCVRVGYLCCLADLLERYTAYRRSPLYVSGHISSHSPVNCGWIWSVVCENTVSAGR